MGVCGGHAVVNVVIHQTRTNWYHSVYRNTEQRSVQLAAGSAVPEVSDLNSRGSVGCSYPRATVWLPTDQKQQI